MFELTADSTAQYQDLGMLTRNGGIEVARTAERMTSCAAAAPRPSPGASRPK